MEIAYFIVVAALIFAVLMWLEKSGWGEKTGCRYDHWNRKWPPISEDEFMERLPPGTDRSVALRTRMIIAEQLGVEYDRVYPEQNFANDLGCD